MKDCLQVVPRRFMRMKLVEMGSLMLLTISMSKILFMSMQLQGSSQQI